MESAVTRKGSVELNHEGMDTDTSSRYDDDELLLDARNVTTRKRSLCRNFLRSECLRSTTFCMIALLVGTMIGYFALADRKVDSMVYFKAELPKEFNTRFVVVGDWGRQGHHHQRDVALQMALVSEILRPDFIVSAGDNFYPSGIKKADDSNFRESFTDVYNSPGLGKEWFSVLGNHDYGDDSHHDLDTRPSFQASTNSFLDERWKCCGGRDFSMQSFNDVDLFFLDTTPFVTKYYSRSWANVPGGLIDEKNKTDSQIQTLISNLSSSKAKWKIVIGHHPVRSNGAHGDTKELVDILPDIFREFKVDMYINGHDHNLQDIVDKKEPSLHYITSGAGSKTRLELGICCNKKNYFEAKAGFVTVATSPSKAKVQFWLRDAKLGYQFEIVKRK